ncbi:MAG: hypothetical protein NZ749_14750, partial [bacterium]|nr:hypothetical protein [bacterium]
HHSPPFQWWAIKEATRLLFVVAHVIALAPRRRWRVALRRDQSKLKPCTANRTLVVRTSVRFEQAEACTTNPTSASCL